MLNIIPFLIALISLNKSLTYNIHFRVILQDYYPRISMLFVHCMLDPFFSILGLDRKQLSNTVSPPGNLPILKMASEELAPPSKLNFHLGKMLESRRFERSLSSWGRAARLIEDNLDDLDRILLDTSKNLYAAFMQDACLQPGNVE